MFNETLLEEGYAQVATFLPNVKYVDRFEDAQAEAQAANRGMWALPAEELAGAPIESRYNRSPPRKLPQQLAT